MVSLIYPDFFNVFSTSCDKAYLGFIFERIRDKNTDGSLQIMYTIHGPYLPSFFLFSPYMKRTLFQAAKNLKKLSSTI